MSRLPVVVVLVALNLIPGLICQDTTKCRESNLDCKLDRCVDIDPKKFSDCRLLVLYTDLLLRWDADDYEGFISTLFKYHRTAVGSVKTVGKNNIMIRNRKDERNIFLNMESSYENSIKQARIQSHLHDDFQDHLTRSLNLVDEHNQRYVKNPDNTYTRFQGPDERSWSEYMTSMVSGIAPTVESCGSTIRDNWRSMSQNLVDKAVDLDGGTTSEMLDSLTRLTGSWLSSARSLYSSDREDSKSLMTYT